MGPVPPGDTIDGDSADGIKSAADINVSIVVLDHGLDLAGQFIRFKIILPVFVIRYRTKIFLDIEPYWVVGGLADKWGSAGVGPGKIWQA